MIWWIGGGEINFFQDIHKEQVHLEELTHLQLIRDKRFRKCKKSRLHVDKRDVKKAQNFFVKKGKNVFENKLTECIGKPKDL